MSKLQMLLLNGQARLAQHSNTLIVVTSDGEVERIHPIVLLDVQLIVDCVLD